MALRDHLRADEDRAIGSDEWSSASRNAPGFDAESASSRIRSSSGTRFSSSASSRCVPAQCAPAPMSRTPDRLPGRPEYPQWWQWSRWSLCSVNETSRARTDGKPTRAAVDRRHEPTAVQQEDRLAPVLRDPTELGKERRRKRVAGFAAQIDDLHRRHRRTEPTAELEPLEPFPALRPRRRAPVDRDSALERGPLRRHRGAS